MFRISLLTITTSMIIAAGAIGATTSTVSARATATQDHDRRLRVLKPQCKKYLDQFQRTGDDFYLRAYRHCIRR